MKSKCRSFEASTDNPLQIHGAQKEDSFEPRYNLQIPGEFISVIDKSPKHRVLQGPMK